MKRYSSIFFVSGLILFGLASQVRADWATATLSAGTNPNAVAVNPATNKIYVANYNSSNVTVIDGATCATATVTAGTNPCAVAVNPVSNMIYIANWGSNDVTVIDGGDNSTSTISVGINPVGLAVNPVTNKIYVANRNSNTVSVINGATGTVDTTLSSGIYPFRVAVNPVTNKIYVVGSYLMVIDGATNGTALINVGNGPRVVAVNAVTNKIYVANDLDYKVNEVNGVTHSITQVATANMPYAMAVNPVTNKIYVTDNSGNNVLAIDGGDHSVDTVAAGSGPTDLAVNPVTNKIYIANEAGNNVTVINGADNSTSTVAAGSGPIAVVVNPVNNKVYVANYSSDNVTVMDGASNVTTTVATGANPNAVAINPVTNNIYVTNNATANVTVIDGATNGTNNVTVGTTPRALTVNPVTNKIYVANNGSNNVTVIDGVTNDTAIVAAGTGPYAVALNPVTNRIYVANNVSNNVTVIDGATNDTATIGVGNSPCAVSVNPVTNKVYVTNSASANITVIDGTTNETLTVAAGTTPISVTVNPVANKIYAANYGSKNVTVIDGATNGTATIGVGNGPCAVSVNSVTNKIYVANYGGANVTVIDGVTNDTTVLSAGTNPNNVAVNPVTNKIYVTNRGSDNVTVIDGATNATTIVTAGTLPYGAAVNPVTGRIYVANYNSNNVTVIDESPASNTQVQAVKEQPSDNLVYQPEPVLIGKAVNRWTPDVTAMLGVLDDWMTGQQAWNWAAGPYDNTSSDSIGWNCNWDTDSLLWGENFVNIVPLEMQAATTNNLGLGTPMAGNRLTVPLYYLDNVPPSQVDLISPDNGTATTGDSLFTFVWHQALENYMVGSYILKIVSDSLITPLVLDTTISVVGDTQKTFTLPYKNIFYSWNVKAVDAANNEGAWSETWRVEIDDRVPNVPVLIEPAENAWINDAPAIFSWTEVSKTAKSSSVMYVLQIDTANTFAAPVIEDTTAVLLDTFNLDEGRYYWRVKAFDLAGNEGTFTAYRHFGVDSAAPNPAAIIGPVSGLNTNQSNIDFNWNSSADDVSGLKHYLLQWAYDDAFAHGLAETTLTDTSIIMVMADSCYYWRVLSEDSAGNTSCSATNILTVDTYDPNIPALIAPYNNDWIEDTSIVFAWAEVVKKSKASEVSYIIQLDTNNTFAAPIIEDTTTTLLDTFNLSEGQYYWRVMAYDAAGNYGTYSSYRNFGIDTTAPLFQDVKTLPDDDMAPYGPYEVTSKVYDLSGVKAAWLHRQVNGGSWDSTAMFFASDSLRDSIPELTPTTDETLAVSYYIKVTDMLDHVTTSSTYNFRCIGPLGISGKPERSMPTVYALDNAYPNPSSGQTTFRYQLPKESNVSLIVYNVVGQQIKRFDIGAKPAGYHQISWNDNLLPNGVYIYQLKAGTFTSTKKLMVIK
jgi:YVTN family beta-propeller protein